MYVVDDRYRPYKIKKRHIFVNETINYPVYVPV